VLALALPEGVALGSAQESELEWARALGEELVRELVLEWALESELV